MCFLEWASASVKGGVDDRVEQWPPDMGLSSGTEALTKEGSDCPTTSLSNVEALTNKRSIVLEWALASRTELSTPAGYSPTIQFVTENVILAQE